MILRFLQASEGGMGGCPLRPGRRLLSLTRWNPHGGRARLVACLPCLWFTFLPPIPPTPFPGGEGGDF